LPETQLATPAKVHRELLRLLRRSDETALSKLLVEWTLLDDVERVSTSEPEYLTQAAKQHRIDTAKVRKAVEQEFAATQSKQEARQNKDRKAAGPPVKKTVVKKGIMPKQAVCKRRPRAVLTWCGR
jgi:hypothetical protein